MQKSSFLIYNASAGSGKTYTLVKEYLKIILVAPEIDAYRSILAITFTNKAVHEMKSRIVGNLTEFAKDLPNKKAVNLMMDLGIEVQQTPLQIKIKSQQIIKHIIHNYTAFDISTIDKFTHKVIRTFAHDLGLQVNFEVFLESDNLLNEAVDAIIAQAGENDVLTKLLVDFTMEKTDDDKSWDISKEILDVGKLILNENNREEISNFKDKSISNFVEIKKNLNDRIKILENENIKSALVILEMIEKKGVDTKSFSRNTFPNHLASITNGKFKNENKKFREFEDVSINKNANDKVLIESLIPKFLQILNQIYKNFEKRDFYKAFLKNIIPVSLLNTLKNELDKIQEEQNILSISEFNAIIHKEIQNQPAPFIYERLGERYSHFFIDEFQDTSEMQWQNLFPLIDNATSSEVNGRKGTLMLVGDPKQSIYRWRGGKAEQFIALSKNFNPFNNPDKEVRYLDRNYRSYKEIIDFNNTFFRLLSGEFENKDYQDLYRNYSFQKSNDKHGGYVNISFIPKIEKDSDSEEEEEAPEKSDLYVQSIKKTIQGLVEKGFDYNDIVILIRHNKNGSLIANYLIENEIPVISSESLLIQNSSEVQAIINVMRFLINKNETESKTRFLEFLSRNFQDKISSHDFIIEGLRKEEKDLEKWMRDYGISISFSDIRKKPLFEVVSIIASKIQNTILHTSDAYVQHFLDIALERQIRNQSGISAFLDYWNEMSYKHKIPSPQGSNSVQIMSIHKSKGLEFPIVIFPFAEENYSLQKKDKLWLNFEEENFDLHKVLIDNNKTVEGYGENAKKTYTAKSEELLLDNINILYVALTRAEEQLFIISSIMKPNKDGILPNNMASYFINFLKQESNFNDSTLEYHFGNSEKKSQEIKTHAILKNIQQVTKQLNPQKIRITQKESQMWGTFQKEAIEYGNIIHEILSLIKTEKDINKAIKIAEEKGLITNGQKKTVCETINQIIYHPELAIFFEEGNEVLNEQSIIQKEVLTIKPDRIVITKNKEIYLLDYKTGKYSEKHKSQLLHYKNAIEKMNFKVTKKALVYIGEQVNVMPI